MKLRVTAALGMALLIAFGLFILGTTSVFAAGNTIYYVTTTGGGDGSGWNAATTLQDALQNRAGKGDEIWVATGVYTPGLSVTDSFTLPEGVDLYGGFAATETLRTQRDWAAHHTVLSGDIAGDDTVDENGVVHDADAIVGDNSTHVVTVDGSKGTFPGDFGMLDGFFITAGQANGGTEKNSPEKYGGGLYCMGNESGKYCAPNLRHIVFSGNMAETGGGAIYAAGYRNGYTALLSSDIAYTGNVADFGGAILLDANTGGSDGSEIVNSTFYGNRARVAGAALYVNASNGGSVTPTLSNLILWGNELASGVDEEIYNWLGELTISYSLIHGGIDGPAIANDADGGSVTDGGGNVDADPRFVDADNLDLRLLSGSPAIDSGNPDVFPLDRDLGANPREVDGDGDGVAVVDLGAYEAPTHYLLNVLKAGAGSGEVTSQPVGINCGTDCTRPVAESSIVTLTAVADDNSTFAGWSGACSGQTCKLSMTSAQTVTAIFNQKPATPTTGSVQGSVLDGNGAGVPGALVTLSDVSGAAKAADRETTTDTQGAYSLSDVPVGTYMLTASKSGYKSVNHPINCR